ncbi:MAG: amidohydrolase family protein [Candidatus Latescibacteria bacterium]|jgi:uncharacterized protein|nr:amidohydrolase family protein [Candidatus Latescibacterota bacterium]
MPGTELYNRIKAEIDTIQVVDMHEHHLYTEEDFLKLNVDFAIMLFQYNSDDLLSAGMTIPNFQEFWDTRGFVLRIDGSILSLEEKWSYIKPYWENVRFTGYGRAVLHSLKKLFGIEDLNDSTFRNISDKIVSLMKPSIYSKIFKGLCGFKYVLNDIDTMVAPGAFERMDRNIFHFVARFRHFTHVHLPGGIEHLENKFDRTIRNIDHLLDALDNQFDRWKQEGRIALKLADAYLRDIHYEDSTRDEAERVLRRIYTPRKHPVYPETLSLSESRPLENFITHRVLDRAEEQNLPVIIHTGIQTFPRNILGNSRAALLTNLFLKYPKIRFHLLHSSYPWMKEAACLAKQFPNVSLDLTWVQVIVPEGAREGLSHMLDTVPINKIHGFGGDYLVPFNVWGSLEVARENIAHVLADKVKTGHMTETQAVDIAWKILNRNAQEIFTFDNQV